MRCHVVRTNAETATEISPVIKNGFLMGPMVWNPGNGAPTMELHWNDDGEAGAPWHNVVKLQDPRTFVADHPGASLIVVGYVPITIGPATLYTRERWTITPLNTEVAIVPAT